MNVSENVVAGGVMFAKVPPITTLAVPKKMAVYSLVPAAR
jgi:hypothetical protein